MLACLCAWCNYTMLEEEAYEIAIYDEEGEITGYELACGCCFKFLLKTLQETL